MGKKRIKVNAGRGVFSSERSVTFDAGGQQYTLIVEKDDVISEGGHDYIEVDVLGSGDNEAIVDLPRETFTSGNRIRVPTNILHSIGAPA